MKIVDTYGNTIISGNYKSFRRMIEVCQKKGKDLLKADLHRSNFLNFKISDMSFSGSNIRRSNWKYAKFTNCKFRQCDFYETDFTGTEFRNCSFYGSDLNGVHFNGTVMDGSSIIHALYSVSSILKCNWGNLSPELTLELMRHDAEFVGTKAMARWVKTGDCPYRDCERDFYFTEKKSLWRKGKPKLRGVELFNALCEEKKIDQNFEQYNQEY